VPINLDDAGEPIKTNRSGSNPGGSGPGTGGGFGAFSGSGFGNPFSGGASRGFGSARRKQTGAGGTLMSDQGMMAPGGPPMNSGGPQGSDTVPAWLTPGEFVMPQPAAQMFGPQLDQMRQTGMAMAGGGMVPENPFHPDAQYMSLGGWISKHPLGAALAAAGLIAAPFLAPAAMGAIGTAGGGFAGAAGTGGAAGAAGAAGAEGASLSGGSGLMGLAAAHPGMAGAAQWGMGQAADRLMPQSQPGNGVQDYYNMRAQGYAWGGPVSPTMGRPQQNPWGRSPMQGGATPVPKPGTPGGGTVAPNPFVQQYDPQGHPSNYDPSNPWGGRAGDTNAGPYGDINRQIGQYGQAGMYNPNGNPQVEAAMRAKAMQDAQAFSGQAYLGADVSGMDPSQAAAYRLQALTSAGAGVGTAMTNYRAQQAQGNQDWARQLFQWNADEAARQQARYQDFRNASQLAGKRP